MAIHEKTLRPAIGMASLNGREASFDQARDKSLFGFSERFQYAAYSAFFAVIYACSYCVDMTSCASYCVLALNVVCYLLGWSRKAAFFSSFIIGNELVSVANMLLGIFALRQGRLRKVHFCPPPSIWLCFFLLLIATAFNSLALDSFLNSGASILYYALLGFIFCETHDLFCKKDVRRCIICFTYCEALCVMLSCLRYGFEPSDYHVGSLGNAHFLGIWCCLALLLFAYCRERNRPRSLSNLDCATALSYVLLLAMLYLSDTKAPVICGVIAVLVLLPIQKAMGRNAIVAALLVLVFLVGASVGLVSKFEAERSPDEGDAFGSAYVLTYVYDDETAIKFDYFKGTMTDLLEGDRIVFGYGLGQYGSRTANLFGYASMDRNDNAVNRLVMDAVESKMLPAYEEYASRYNRIEDIGRYSVVLVSPFSSFVSFLAEGGIIAFILLCLLLRWMKLDPGIQIVFMFFVGCCLVDLYLDHIQLAGLLVFALSLGARMKPECERLRSANESERAVRRSAM